MLTINVDVYNVYISVILALHLKPNYIQRGKLVYAPHKYSSCRVFLQMCRQHIWYSPEEVSCPCTSCLLPAFNDD